LFILINRFKKKKKQEEKDCNAVVSIVDEFPTKILFWESLSVFLIMGMLGIASFTRSLSSFSAT
jgi:hypothetical protein